RGIGGPADARHRAGSPGRPGREQLHDPQLSRVPAGHRRDRARGPRVRAGVGPGRRGRVHAGGARAGGARGRAGRGPRPRGGGPEVRAGVVVVATGVSYHRLAAAGAEALIGRGVFYGAAIAEARALSGQDVFVVGGGNSAGQAAVHLGRCGARVILLVRGSSLAAGMSDYLVKQIERARLPVRLDTEVVRAIGSQHLEEVELGSPVASGIERLPAAALFVLIRAGPRTAWLAAAPPRAERGLVRPH